MLKSNYNLSNCINNVNLSNEANNVISYYKNKNIIYFQEMLDHDGYDSYGPESNLWDLDIIIEINNDYIFYNYHWEDWYSKNQERKYNLYQPKLKLSQTTKENIHYFDKHTNDSKFNEAFKERSKILFYHQVQLL